MVQNYANKGRADDTVPMASVEGYRGPGQQPRDNIEGVIWKRIADLRRSGLSHNVAVVAVADGIACFIADSLVDGGMEISDNTIERYRYARYLKSLL